MIISKNVRIDFKEHGNETDVVYLSFESWLLARKFKRFAQSKLIFAEVHFCSECEPSIVIEGGLDYRKSLRRQIASLQLSENADSNIRNFFLSPCMIDFLKENGLMKTRVAMNVKASVAAN